MSEARELADNCNQLCYCGRIPSFYDGLFERNFCSDDCVNRLREFFSNGPNCRLLHRKVVEAVERGDFIIQGSTVILKSAKAESKPSTKLESNSEATFGRFQQMVSNVDSAISRINEEDKMRKDLKKMGLPDQVIEQMITAKREAK